MKGEGGVNTAQHSERSQSYLATKDGGVTTQKGQPHTRRGGGRGVEGEET